MAHINFNLQGWLLDNPNAKMSDLCEAIQSANEVYCGWTVEDAEVIRANDYENRTDLSIEDSHQVISIASDDWDADRGFGWQDLSREYHDYVNNLDAARK